MDKNGTLGKLFIGGLSRTTTREGLKTYFEKFGVICDAIVMKHMESGQSRGFGFVTFADPTKVHTVLESGPHIIDDKQVDAKQCSTRPASQKIGANKVFLGGLPDISEENLKSFFSRYGEVKELLIMVDGEKRSRGFGFLTFVDEDSVDLCISDKFVDISGKKVEVKRALARSFNKKPNNRENPSSVQYSSVNSSNDGKYANIQPSSPGQCGSVQANTYGNYPAYFNSMPQYGPGPNAYGYQWNGMQFPQQQWPSVPVQQPYGYTSNWGWNMQQGSGFNGQSNTALNGTNNTSNGSSALDNTSNYLSAYPPTTGQQNQQGDPRQNGATSYSKQSNEYHPYRR